MTTLIHLPFLLFSLIARVICVGYVYEIDDSIGVERRYDGVGGLSGGSATSKLLKAYPEKQRNEILDYLFKPNFAASLQILKVEIGGDSQSSDATEASHMHYSWEENYHRGYEWWMMKEAQKRNPDIKLIGLPWNFPGWIGNGTQNPYDNPLRLAVYVRKWIQGAIDVHNLIIDYIGIWNERPYNIEYIKVLRRELDITGFSHTRIIAGDNGRWIVQDDILKDKELADAVDIIGVHYPRQPTPIAALQTGKPLWASEEYSSVNNNHGGGVWAKAINENYVDRFVSSAVAWNLIDSYYEGLTWDRNSLMTARQPWSGHYIVESPIWVSAHTTQFTNIGWHYLWHGSGVGHFQDGGSYVSIISPDRKDLTIVIEMMTKNHSFGGEISSVKPQNVTFRIGGSFASVKQLSCWYTKLGFNGSESIYFTPVGMVLVINGLVNLTVGLDEIYTLTTVKTGKKGDYGIPPPYQQFPLPYAEDFEKYVEHEEPLLFAQQNGAFEVIHDNSSAGNVMRQMVTELPIVWCQPHFDKYHATMNVIGSVQWRDVYIEANVRRSRVNGSSGMYIAARVNDTGCTYFNASAIFFSIHPESHYYIVTADLGKSNILMQGSIYHSYKFDWNNIGLDVKGDIAVGYFNNEQLFRIKIPSHLQHAGFTAVGTETFGLVDFDNIKIAKDRTQAELLSFKSDIVNKHSNDNILYFKPRIN